MLRDLAGALRAHEPALDYWPVDPAGTLGDHAIAVGMLYRDGAISPLGPASVLDERVHSSFDSRRNRPSLAQTFLHLGSGEVVTVVVNHFKSKGSSCSAVGDPDLGDGQGPPRSMLIPYTGDVCFRGSKAIPHEASKTLG